MRCVPRSVAYPVCAHDHGHGVPPYYASYVALYFVVAGVRGLVLHGYGVHVGGVCGVGELDAFFLGVYPELSQQFGRPLAPGILDHVLKRFDPFSVFSFFFRYLRIFFHCLYKTRRSGAAGEFCNMEKPCRPCNLEPGLRRSKRWFGPEAEAWIQKIILTAEGKISLLLRNYFWASFMTIKAISSSPFFGTLLLNIRLGYFVKSIG